MSTSNVSADDASVVAGISTPTRQRVGMVLLVVGLVLTIGGFFLPWLSVSCIATCKLFSAIFPVTRGPIETAGVGLFTLLFPGWVLVAIAALLTARQELRPVDRRRARPTLVVALLLVLWQAYILWVLQFAIRYAGNPVLAFGLLPSVAVSPLGTVLIAIGGWLRYHPYRTEASRKLAQVPTER